MLPESVRRVGRAVPGPVLANRRPATASIRYRPVADPAPLRGDPVPFRCIDSVSIRCAELVRRFAADSLCRFVSPIRCRFVASVQRPFGSGAAPKRHLAGPGRAVCSEVARAWRQGSLHRREVPGQGVTRYWSAGRPNHLATNRTDIVNRPGFVGGSDVPRKCWSWLILETRMEPCRRTRHLGGRPRAGTLNRIPHRQNVSSPRPASVIFLG